MLDLESARRALWKWGSNVPYSTASSNDIGEFDFKLMQVVERFFTLGTWRNMWRRLNLAIYDDTLTLPRGFDTLRQISNCGCGPTPIYSQFHRFAGLGFPFDPLDTAGWYSGLTLIDEQAQTFRIPRDDNGDPVPFTLRAVATEVNADGFTFIGGFDADENELFGEITLALVNGAANGTQQYTQLPRIEKAVTTNPVLLYGVNVDTGEATLIASYAPGETQPTYRQYSTSGICSTTDDDDDPPVVSAICKLGFTLAVASNDLVIPGHIGALKLGLQALQFEDKVDPANASLYWGPNFPAKTGRMHGAIDLLDAELEELQSAEMPALHFSRDFGAGSVHNAR